MTSSKMSHSTVFAGDFAQAFEETFFRHDQAHVAWDRLNDDSGDLRWMLLKEGTHTRQIVVLGYQRFLGHICWHTRTRCTPKVMAPLPALISR